MLCTKSWCRILGMAQRARTFTTQKKRPQQAEVPRRSHSQPGMCYVSTKYRLPNTLTHETNGGLGRTQEAHTIRIWDVFTRYHSFHFVIGKLKLNCFTKQRKGATKRAKLWLKRATRYMCD